MKFLKKLFVFLFVVALVAVVVSQFLPGHYRVQRSVIIDAKAEQIYPWISNLRKWPEWSAWTTAKDPTLEYTYEGPEGGVGAVSKWEGKKVGQGQMTIVTANPTNGVTFDLSFDHGKFLTRSSVEFAPAGFSTKVNWMMEGDVNRNPINRFLGVIMERMIAPDFEEGLRNLKHKAEAK